jgi:hypothetical protein
MSSNPTPHEGNPPESWLGVAAGLAIFLIADLMLILNEIPLAAQPASWAWTLRILSFWGMILVPAVGLTIGWIKGFPRWTYPYVPLAVFFSLYIANASTPGLTFFGYPTFGRQLWGLRAFIPLLLGGLIAWLVTRSFKPLKRFFTQIGEDWTLGSYALSGTLPLVIFIAYDEMDQAYSLRNIFILTALQLLMTLIYLRSQSSRRRRFAVGIGIPLILVYTAVSTTLFWYSQGPGNVYLPGMIAWTVVLVYIYLSPGIMIGLVRASLASKSGD